jgi:hypothetical protein
MMGDKIIMAGKKKTSKKPPVKKRKNRSKFRPSFRDRAIFSFACAMLNIDSIRNAGDENEDLLGMGYISCFRNLSHSIEMLCKAVLAQRSLFLLHKNLNSFDELFPKPAELEENCGAWVALARASKLFKSDFSNEDSGRLERILFARNRCEHGEFFIPNFKTEMHTIASAAEIVVRVYDMQFRNGNLLEEIKRYGSKDIVNAYHLTIQENSKDFKELETKVAALKKGGGKFIFCWNCHYGFAQLNAAEDEYTCLWCNDVRKKKICQAKNCGDVFWDAPTSTRLNCSKFHLGDSINLTGLTLSQLSGVGATSVPSHSEVITFGSSAPGSGSVITNAIGFNSWIDMAGAANPKSDEDQSTDDKPIDPKESEEK